MERLYHLIKSEDLSLPIIERLFQRTEFYEEGLRKKVTERIALPRDLDGVRVYIVFLEESTRTYSTFNSAALELGALVTGFPLAKVFSSFAKEEALKHAMEFWSGAGISYLRLADIIVLRHFEVDAAERAAGFSRVPIINAGTGGEDGEHPTQGLLDNYGFRKFLGKSNSLSIAFMGDVRFSRIVLSELPILHLLYPNLKVYIAAPEGFGLNTKARNYLIEKKIPFKETKDGREVVNECQICYVLRVQKNRLKDLVEGGLLKGEEAERLLQLYQENRDNYAVTKELYEISERKGTIFCHPGPISEKEQEIRPEVENLPRVKFLKQWAYGFPMRMAILAESWETQREIDMAR